MTPIQFFNELPLNSQAHIINHMTQPHLIYHNFSHAVDVANWAHYAEKREDLPFFYYAAFYHDIIYDPTKSGGINEEKSAEMFESHADQNGISVNSDLYKDVCRAIRLSKNHFAPEAYTENQRINRFLDYDLVGLALPNLYELNSKKIRLEFSHATDEEWRVGRTKFLETVLATPKIYRDMTDSYEERARENISRELLSLTPQFLETT